MYYIFQNLQKFLHKNANHLKLPKLDNCYEICGIDNSRDRVSSYHYNKIFDTIIVETIPTVLLDSLMKNGFVRV